MLAEKKDRLDKEKQEEEKKKLENEKNSIAESAIIHLENNKKSKNTIIIEPFNVDDFSAKRKSEASNEHIDKFYLND